ncbi:AraC family transcriptional regulator [Bacillus sp. UMB0899]|nr:AraC family transcriptional regulator [Bacillus sp. UMB0899]
MNLGSLYSINNRDRCHPKVTAYYFKEWNEFQMMYHSHEAIEIMYVLSGQCIIEINGKALHLKKNQFVLIDSQVPHRLIVNKDQPCRMLNLEFTLTEVTSRFPSIKELAKESKEIQGLLSSEQDYHLLKDNNGVYNSLRNLVLELDSKSNDNQLLVYLLISQLLVLISRTVAEAKVKSFQQSDVYVKKVVNYLHENYDYDIKIEDLSSLTHLHPNYLHRIFKETMDCTIIDYLTKIRINKAKMLISQTDIPITDVSSFIGMNSSQYFSKVFKKYTGYTPMEYRKHVCNTYKRFDVKS